MLQFEVKSCFKIKERVILKTDPNKATKVVQYFIRNKKFYRTLLWLIPEKNNFQLGHFVAIESNQIIALLNWFFLKLLSEKELPAIAATLNYLIFHEIQKIQQSYLKRSEKRTNRVRFVK